MGNNSAGMTGKLESLKRAIEVFNPGVIMLQETKLKRQGLIKLKDFVVFEKLRENTEGGGLMSVIHENLKPILISDDHSEFLVVDVTGNFGSIRLINCYGPQENLPLEVRTEFFIELESRIFSAKTNGKLN
jgi:exonuclease III